MRDILGVLLRLSLMGGVWPWRGLRAARRVTGGRSELDWQAPLIE
jgi:hypothetical protein